MCVFLCCASSICKSVYGILKRLMIKKYLIYTHKYLLNNTGFYCCRFVQSSVAPPLSKEFILINCMV